MQAKRFISLLLGFPTRGVEVGGDGLGVLVVLNVYGYYDRAISRWQKIVDANQSRRFQERSVEGRSFLALFSSAAEL